LVFAFSRVLFLADFVENKLFTIQAFPKKSSDFLYKKRKTPGKTAFFPRMRGLKR